MKPLTLMVMTAVLSVVVLACRVCADSEDARRPTAPRELVNPVVETVPSADDIRASLEAFRDQYLSLSAMNQTWLVGLNLDPGNQPLGPFIGFYRSAISGDRYRCSIEAPFQPDLTTNLEIAFDGAYYQLLDKASGVLSRQRKDSKQSPMAFSNPLFLPLDFLSQDGDACDSCALRVVDLIDPQVWDSRLRDLSVVSFDPDAQSVVFVVPAPRRYGVGYAFVVTMLGTTPNQLPVQIDRVSQEGETVTRISLNDYQLQWGVGGAIMLPGHITYDAFSCPGGGKGVGPRIDFTHTQSLLSRESVESNGLTFSIDQSRANAVWDSDARTFMKRP